MKANELRIGNWVFYQNDHMSFPKVHQVDGDNIGRLHDYEKHSNQSSLSFFAIPLTQDWLQKFGFEMDGIKNYVRYVKKIYLDVWLDGEVFMTEKSHEGVRLQQLIKYVHQLQNLCFALTGEELTIKEPQIAERLKYNTTQQA